MTIDEAIEKYKEITNPDTICLKHCDMFCDKCVQESEQLVEWEKQIRKTAIDDFVRFANTMPTVEEEDGTIRPMWLEEIAEQLKNRWRE